MIDENSRIYWNRDVAGLNLGGIRCDIFGFGFGAAPPDYLTIRKRRNIFVRVGIRSVVLDISAIVVFRVVPCQPVFERTYRYRKR